MSVITKKRRHRQFVRSSQVPETLSAFHRCEQPDVIATGHARNGSSLGGLQKIIAKAREDATQVKIFNAYLRWARFEKACNCPLGFYNAGSF